MELNRMPLSKQIAEDLKMKIIRGEILPGQRLPIAELRTMYGVSSTPIRDALQDLQHMGFVIAANNSTCIVPKLTKQQKEQLLEVYELNTPATVALFIRNADREQMVRQFEQAYERLVASEGEPAGQRMRRYAQVQNLIIENCGNPYYEYMTECWQGHYILAFGNYVECLTIEEALENARLMVEAVRAWDGDAIIRQTEVFADACRRYLQRQE